MDADDWDDLKASLRKVPKFWSPPPPNRASDGTERPVTKRSRRILRQTFLSHVRGGRMMIEFSPRRVKCDGCTNSILGNDEPRFVIDVPSGYSGSQPNQFWMQRSKVRFHLDCIRAFIDDSDMPERTGPPHYDSCDVCYHYTSRPIVDGMRLCGECNKIYSKRAQRKVLKSLKAIMEDRDVQ